MRENKADWRAVGKIELGDDGFKVVPVCPESVEPDHYEFWLWARFDMNNFKGFWRIQSLLTFLRSSESQLSLEYLYWRI